MERYGDEEQRSRSARPAATHRDATPCHSQRRCASSKTISVIGAPCHEPQITAS